MQVHLSADEPLAVGAGTLVVPFFSGIPLESVAQEADRALGGVIADALASGEVRGKLGDHVLFYAQGQPYRRVLAISLGEPRISSRTCSRVMPARRFAISDAERSIELPLHCPRKPKVAKPTAHRS